MSAAPERAAARTRGLAVHRTTEPPSDPNNPIRYLPKTSPPRAPRIGTAEGVACWSVTECAILCVASEDAHFGPGVNDVNRAKLPSLVQNLPPLPISFLLF